MSEDKHIFEISFIAICKKIVPLLEKKFTSSEKRENIYMFVSGDSIKFTIRLNPFCDKNESYTQEEAESFFKTMVLENYKWPDNWEILTSVSITTRAQNEKNEIYSFRINFKKYEVKLKIIEEKGDELADIILTNRIV